MLNLCAVYSPKTACYYVFLELIYTYRKENKTRRT
nr:MAG TPA: RimK-like ATPgrasp N-terminal domain [Caudoviricetes sp.]DAE76991.1 MAG TPA: RimK-like ATPgrasp N-terminal domain [Caudoviricetes sp.]DAN86095.1 MAG TPA: RimK-like ATPgrasp N-terminal domain [Caudoviricetes sp.]DAX30104.1 MAG TPA: RimK-like ATPgrasp N-terminal domain [Caudoviricetes sp.]DAZ60414.1 MAG TPA: RimK-like ATPgrasp N-terminal domain [Caudoviricetes sp.]